MNATVTALVLKDLYLNRWPIAGTLAAGTVSLGLCLVHPIGIVVGGIAYLSAIIAFGCVIAMGIWKERENGTLLFSLSLPLSAREYLAARTAGAALSYLAVWVPLLAGAAVTISLSAVLAHGLVLLITLVSVFLLLEFCLLIGVALMARSEGPMVGALIVTNTLVSIYWWALESVPSVARSVSAPAANWDGAALGILAVQLVLAVLLLILPVQFGATKSLL